jgi:hypothetical protein
MTGHARGDLGNSDISLEADAFAEDMYVVVRLLYLLHVFPYGFSNTSLLSPVRTVRVPGA